MSIKSRALAIFAALVFALTATVANADSMTGTWRGSALGILFQLVVQPSGAYVETESKGTMMTQQSGAVVPAGPGMVSFTVTDWSPRTQPIYHPTGTVGGCYTQEPTARPPGGTWRLVFNGPNSFTITDVNLGGSLTFNRVG